MRVALLLEDGDPHGLRALAHGLEAAGLALTPLDAGEAAGTFDLAVATGARSAAALEAVAAPARALLLMDFDDRALVAGSAEAAAAARVYDLALPTLVPARWMAEQLDALRPPSASRAVVVPIGVDRDVFAPPAAPPVGPSGVPLRVLALGTPGVARTGLDEALAAVAAMRQPATVSQFDHASAAPAARAAAYARADVVLALPRIAGLPIEPLLGFHAGATAVMTAVTGHDEYVVDGVNALLTSWDDERGTSRLLDLLARDRALLGRLRAGALDTARAWPGIDEAAGELAAAVRQIVAAPLAAAPTTAASI